MLIRVKKICGYKLHGKDGEIGKLKEIYFDDAYWTVRYMVVDTGTWLDGHKVLLTPHAVRKINCDERYIDVNLTNKQIEESPPLESHKPVSRQYEEEYYGYYGWPRYWEGPYMWGAYPYIGFSEIDLPKPEPKKSQVTSDSHLRSTSDVTGYTIHARDARFGDVADFIIDDITWQIKYLVIDTIKWLPGKKVLISPEWIQKIDWVESNVYVDLSKEAIKQAPDYTDETEITDEYAKKLYRHYYSDN